jgi:hypothetical protein
MQNKIKETNIRDRIESYLCMNIAIAMFSVTCLFISIVQKREILQIKQDAKEVVQFIAGR